MVDLYALAEQLRVMVREAHLTSLRGLYHPQLRLIVISTALTKTQRICTLAHELGHAHYDDHPTTDAKLESFQERRANQWAAQRVITPSSYEQAEDECGPHVGAIAQNLDVTREIVEAWRTAYRRKH